MSTAVELFSLEKTPMIESTSFSSNLLSVFWTSVRYVERETVISQHWVRIASGIGGRTSTSHRAHCPTNRTRTCGQVLDMKPSLCSRYLLSEMVVLFRSYRLRMLGCVTQLNTNPNGLYSSFPVPITHIRYADSFCTQWLWARSLHGGCFRPSDGV